MAVSCTVSCIVSTNNANFFGIILKLWGKERVITLDRFEKSPFFLTSIINFVKFFSQSRYMLSYNTNFIFVLYVGIKLLDKKIYNYQRVNSDPIPRNYKKNQSQIYPGLPSPLHKRE